MTRRKEMTKSPQELFSTRVRTFSLLEEEAPFGKWVSEWMDSICFLILSWSHFLCLIKSSSLILILSLCLEPERTFHSQFTFFNIFLPSDSIPFLTFFQMEGLSIPTSIPCSYSVSISRNGWLMFLQLIVSCLKKLRQTFRLFFSCLLEWKKKKEREKKRERKREKERESKKEGERKLK